MGFNVVGYLTIIVCLIHIVLLFFVINSKKRSKYFFWYISIIVSILLWSLATFFYNSIPLGHEVLLLKLVYVFSNCIVVSYTFFAHYFPKVIKTKYKVLLLILLFLVVPSMYILLFTDMLIVDVKFIPEQYLSVAQMGDGYLIYMLPTFLGVFFVAIYLLAKIKRFSGYNRNQMKFFFWGSIFMFLPTIFLDYFVPIVFGNTEFYRWGPVFGIIFNVCIVYSMLATRFMGVRSIIGSFIKYVLIFLFNTGILLGSYHIIAHFGNDISPVNRLVVIFFFLAPISVYINTKIFRRISNKIKNVYINPSVDFEDEEQKYFNFLENELNLDKIGEETIRFLKRIFGIDRVTLFLCGKGENDIVYQRVIKVRYVDQDDLLSILLDWDTVSTSNILLLSEVELMTTEELIHFPNTWKRVLTFMKYNNISLIYKMPERLDLRGLIIIGFEETERFLTKEDLAIIEGIGKAFSGAMGRSRLYKKIHDFNKDLKTKVDEQTREIHLKMERMKELRQREKDMLDILGHELRTPLTIIKNAIELIEYDKEIKEKSNEILKWDGTVQDQFNYIKSGLRRELRLVETLLLATKLDASRLQANICDVDLVKIIKNTCYAFKREADIKHLKLLVKYQKKKKWIAKADNLHSQQIVDNLVSNAIKYTFRGHVEINLIEEGKYIVLSVKDTGEGIRKHNLAKLGQKFYRVNQYISKKRKKNSVIRPGGTGLGLYVTFGLIKAMGGKYEIQTEIGKGSTFKIFFPTK